MKFYLLRTIDNPTEPATCEIFLTRDEAETEMDFMRGHWRDKDMKMEIYSVDALHIQKLVSDLDDNDEGQINGGHI